MKKSSWLILIIILVLLIIFLLPRKPSVEQPGVTNQGRVVFTITDAAANLSSVTSVKVTVDKVTAHNTQEGWIDVSNSPKTYDLLELKNTGNQVLLADVQLKTGNYEQVRLDISKVVVTDADGEHEAKLPSGELKIIGNLTVAANSTATVSFDFILDESLHVTGNGEYILAPVVKLETRENADVEIKDNKVTIKSGKVKTNVKVGMDENGNVAPGLMIARNKTLEIAQGKIKIAEEVKENKTNKGTGMKTSSGYY